MNHPNPNAKTAMPKLITIIVKSIVIFFSVSLSSAAMHNKKPHAALVLCIEESQFIHSGYSPGRFLLPLSAHLLKIRGANPA
jgi:hypothetical protein